MAALSWCSKLAPTAWAAAQARSSMHDTNMFLPSGSPAWLQMRGQAEAKAGQCRCQAKAAGEEGRQQAQERKVQRQHASHNHTRTREPRHCSRGGAARQKWPL